MFTDVVGSTALLTALGPREAERLRHEHFAALRQCIEGHGGREVKTLGDGIMAGFASARASIGCAIAIQHTSARSTRRGRPPIAIRVGISSGDVNEEDGDCFGAAVIEASRLCDAAAPGEVLLAEATRLLARDYQPLSEVGVLELKGLSEPTHVWAASWSPDEQARVRAVLADDAVLVREGIAQVLEGAGIEVVGQAGNGEELLTLTRALRPDIAIVDVRMPPTHTVEGLDVAVRIRSEHPQTAVLVLTQEMEPRYARRLAAVSTTGVGYLVKESVTDLRAFTDAARHVAAGGTAFERGLLAGEVSPQ